MFGLNKLADKDFVIGFVLPVLMAAIAVAALSYDLGPAADIVAGLKKDNAFANLTLVVLVLWLVAVLLLNFNRSLYRLLEGYNGPLKSKYLLEREKETQRQQKSKLEVMHAICGFSQMPPSPEQELARSHYAAAEAEYLLTFPDVNDLMPTRFGNVIKAFENYSKRVYGLEGTAGWTRLVAVVPSSYGAVINDARSEVDFCVNLCALSVFVSLLSLVRFALSASGVALEGPTIAFLLGSLAALVVAYAAYRGAVERAGAWGDTVKAAFDLYLPAMAKQLGYELPATLELRADFWDCVNSQMLLHIPINPAEWRPLESAPAEAPCGGEEEQGGGGGADDDKEDSDGGEEPEGNCDRDGDEPPDPAQPGSGNPADRPRQRRSSLR